MSKSTDAHRRWHHGGEIDFDTAMKRQSDPMRERAKIGMSGKFLLLKYYSATGDAQAYAVGGAQAAP
jgi:hypothetical protein